MQPNICFCVCSFFLISCYSWDFLPFLPFSSTSSSFFPHPPPPAVFFFFFRRQSPGVISKVSVGDSLLSLKSLRNRPCSLLSSIVCSFPSIPFSLSPSLLPYSLAHCCLSHAVRKICGINIFISSSVFASASLVFSHSLATVSPSHLVFILVSICFHHSRLSRSLPFPSLSISLMRLSLSLSNPLCFTL